MAEAGVVRDVPRAVAAARSAASALGLSADEAIVLHASNRLALRLLPSDVLARVASDAHEAAQFEVDLTLRLAGTDTPVAALDPRVAPRVYACDGFTITLWTYYAAESSHQLAPAAYADALSRLHIGMHEVDLSTPHYTDRVKEAETLVASLDRTQDFTDADQDLLTHTLRSVSRAISERRAREQLLHGEPHPGNVLNTKNGPLFIDLETCCRGPIEFDLAHVPDAVSDRYPNVDQSLLRQCRVLALAMVAAWRLDPEDRLPSGRQAAREILSALRAGPPYPRLGAITGLE
jgi:aminoglycoside phosphotransferase (APT) family kinase protein